jgi:hypothetical protein
MLMAVEMWMKRDHQAEWNQWLSWLNHIAGRISTVESVTTSIEQPEGLSNRTPSLRIRWDRSRLGISGRTVARYLFETDPRIATPGGRGGTGTETGMSITPYMMSPGDEVIIADRLHALLSNPPEKEVDEQLKPPSADVSGRWDVLISYVAGESNHVLYLKQQGNRIEGTHQGEFVSRDLSGSISGDSIRMSSAYTERHGDSLMFSFAGTISGNEMSGPLDMGEYLAAKWTARRHEYRKD